MPVVKRYCSGRAFSVGQVAKLVFTPVYGWYRAFEIAKKFVVPVDCSKEVLQW